MNSAENQVTEKKAGRMALMLIFLIVFIDLLGFGIIIPIMPQCAREFGATPTQVGLLIMAYSLAQFFLTPIWGRLSDNVGRRPILLISLAASAIGYAIWGFATTLTMLFISRIVAGLGNANIAVAQAYIADVTKPEERAKGMGMIGAAFGLGFTLGPAIGGALSLAGFHAVGYAAAACSGLALLVACFSLKEPEKRTQAGHERFHLDPGFIVKAVSDPKLSTSLLIFFLSTFAFANMEATLALLAAAWYKFGKSEISWLFTYIGFVMVFVQGGLIRQLSKRCSEKSLISVGAIFLIAGLLLTALLQSVGGLYIAMTLLAVGTSIVNPANQSMTSKLADQDQVGGVLGVGQSLSTLGRVLGPIVGAVAFEQLGIPYPYYVGAAVMFVVLLLSFALPKLDKDGNGSGKESAGEPAKAGI